VEARDIFESPSRTPIVAVACSLEETAPTIEEDPPREEEEPDLEAMADKTLCEFSAPITANIRLDQQST